MVDKQNRPDRMKMALIIMQLMLGGVLMASLFFMIRLFALMAKT